jgi:pilus assembly protein CpaE
VTTFILSDDPALTQQVRDALLREGETCPPEQVLFLDQADRLARTPAGLVLLVLGSQPERALYVLERLQDQGSMRVLAVGPAGDSRLLLRVIRAGASDFVDEANLQADLRACLARLQLTHGERGKSSKVVAVFGPSGGSGASTLAVNLSVALAQKKHQLLLVDLRLPLGDLAALLDLKPTHSLAELCPHADRLDHSMLERTLVSHESGVKLLAAPLSHADSAHVTADGVREIIRLARRLFSFVIVDVDHSLGPEQLEALTAADVIVLVLHLQFICVRRTCQTLDFLERLGVSRERIRVVVNRYGDAREVPTAKAEKVLGLAINHYIPDDPRSVNQSGNDGLPVVLASPRARVSRSLIDLATSLNGKS